jgi:hypothetical protein
MSHENQENRLQVTRRQDGVIVVEGALNQRNAEAFQSALESLNLEPNGEIVLAMFGFDVDDGIGVVTAINALRDLLKRASKLKLIGAPQILCHNLYRVGMLELGHAVELIDMREDEPYG